MSIIDLNKKIHVLVDANSYVHSAFNGHEPKIDKGGKDQRVLWGLVEMMVSLSYQLERIDSIFVIFDPKDNFLYRRSQFPAYKANRPPSDPELERQKEDAKFILRNRLGVPNVHVSGYEADDIIGSLAFSLVSEEDQIVVVSPDKDLLQLVKKNIFIMRKRRKKGERGYEVLDESVVKEKYGVLPFQIPDWLSLMGDTIDNLPGLYNVGEKTAAKILSVYPSVEHLLSIKNHIEDIKLREKVIENADGLLLVKRLATVVTDLPVKVLSEKEISLCIEMRRGANYNKTLQSMENYFGWPSYFKDIFYSD